MCSLVRFLLLHLRRLRRHKDIVQHDEDPDPRGPFKAIPTEVMLLIAEYLSPASITAFCLTCKPFYGMLHHFTPLLRTVKQQEEFLQLLEKDTPDLYFCHECVMLHPLKLPQGRREPACVHMFQAAMPFDLGMWFEYGWARLAMNRHFYGAKHENLLKNLCLDRKEREYNEATMKQNRVARILDDELYTLSTCTISDSRGDNENVRWFFRQRRLHICHHVNIHGSVCADVDLQGTLKAMLAPSFGTEERDRLVGSCARCLTDFVIEITGRGTKKGLQVQINVYQQFGSCRSPHDWKWRNMAERYSDYNEPRYAIKSNGKLVYPPGAVRRRWLREETTETLEEHSQFVGKLHARPTYITGLRRCPWGLNNILAAHNCLVEGADCATYGLKDKPFSLRQHRLESP